MVIYKDILTLEKVGTMVTYHGIFITLAPGASWIRTFKLRNISQMLYQMCQRHWPRREIFLKTENNLAYFIRQLRVEKF
jgi:hypothetical protein